MQLEKEIETVKRTVSTDAYQMSIGEVMNLYTEKDLIINPAFQRLFRWDVSQKSKFIESLLLGIPIPSIFVFENSDGKWELVDGLQRISTVLEFVGILDPKGEGNFDPPSCLEATGYLPSLHNAVWEKSKKVDDVLVADQNPIGKTQQLAIKRSRIGVEILKRPSDAQTKYDLFQRLNSGGTTANPQELRNCIVVMVNEVAFKSMDTLANHPSFAALVQFTDDQRTSQKHLEYAMRFLVYRHVPYDGKLDVEEYFDRGIVKLLESGELNKDAQDNFKGTFDLIVSAVGKDGLKRFTAGQFKGRVGLIALETIGVGIAANLNAIKAQPDAADFVKKKIHDIWKKPELEEFGKPGVRGTQRIRRSVPFGAAWFKP